MELQFITKLPMLAIENIESFTGKKEELKYSFIKELKKEIKDYIKHKQNNNILNQNYYHKEYIELL
jgi:hypothetical protein